MVKFFVTSPGFVRGTINKSSSKRYVCHPSSNYFGESIKQSSSQTGVGSAGLISHSVQHGISACTGLCD